jgi:hypothetical protein
MMAPRYQLVNQVGPDESRGAGDKAIHPAQDKVRWATGKLILHQLVPVRSGPSFVGPELAPFLLFDGWQTEKKQALLAMLSHT